MELALRDLRDHPDQQIHDAIIHEEWRRALQMIEKREKKLKKGQTSDWLTACKASVLLMLPEPAKKRQGRLLLDSILSRNPPVIDFNAVETIQSFAEMHHEIDPRIDNLWMQAANAQPSDEQLHKCWFHSRFRMRDWQGARKAGMTYTKHFPTRRDPFFWTIFANFMASKTLPDVNSEKQLCGTMAYRMCAKAAEAVVFEPDQELSNGRVIRTVDDLVFLLDVYESQGKYEEAIMILESHRTGIKSRIGRRSWKLVTSKIRLLGSAHRWLHQFRFCFELLEDASPVNDKPPVHGFGKLGNDGYVWNALVNSALSLKFPTCFLDRDDPDTKPSETEITDAINLNVYKSTRLAIASLLDDYRMDRNATCAGMLWASKLEADVRGENLATKALQYFEAYGHKIFCFNDLQPYVGAMRPPVVQSFLHKINAWLMERGLSLFQFVEGKKFDPKLLVSKTNALKLEYCLTHSRVNEKTKVEAFIVECIRCYDRGLKNYGNNVGQPMNFAERFPGDDAGLLAAATLLKFSGDYQDHRMLRAVLLLDELSKRSPAMYEAFGTLILLYIRIGAGSLAATTYHGLSIKNIQLPTLPWLLWTRLSTVHPHGLVSRKLRLPDELRASSVEADPVQQLTQALDYHASLRGTDKQEIFEFLERKQYASLHRAMDNSLHNHNGFVKYLLLVEWARVERISGLLQKRDYRILFDQPAIIYENRDQSSVPNWEHPNSTPLLLNIMPGEWPTIDWLSHQMSIAHIFANVTDGSGSMEELNVCPQSKAYSEPEKSMTREEHGQLQTAMECQTLLNDSEIKGAGTAVKTAAAWAISATLDSIEKRQQAVNDELATIKHRRSEYFTLVSEGVLAPSWLFFHTAYISLDTAILIKKTLIVFENANRNHRVVDPQAAGEQIGRIRTLCEMLHVTIHDVASKLYEDFSSNRYHEPIVRSIIGRPSDPEKEDPIAYWLRDHFNRGADDAYTFVQAFVTRLCQSWCEALQNLCNVTSPP